MLVFVLATALALPPLKQLNDSAGTVPFRALSNPEPSWSAQAASERLLQLSEVDSFETNGVAGHVWVQVDLDETPGAAWLMLPSKHLRAVQCWGLPTAAALADGTRHRTIGPIQQVGPGYAVAVDAFRSAGADRLLCRLSQNVASQLVVVPVELSDVLQLNASFQRESSLLEGAALMLSVSLLVAAGITRKPVFLMFGLWIIANQRLAALSSGADWVFLGFAIPEAIHDLTRRLTVALYYCLGHALFLYIFRRQPPQGFTRQVNQVIVASCAALIGLAVVLTYAQLLLAVTVLACISIPLVLFRLVRILSRRQDGVTLLYALSLITSIACAMHELLATAFGATTTLPLFSRSFSVLAPSLLVSLAVAVQLRDTRLALRRARTRLRAALKPMPIGLFSATTDGHIMEYNSILAGILQVRRPEVADATTPAVSDSSRWHDSLMLSVESTLGSQFPHWDDWCPNTPWRQLVARAMDAPNPVTLHRMVRSNERGPRRERPYEPRSPDVANKLGAAYLQILEVRLTSAPGGRVEGVVEDVTDRVKQQRRLEDMAKSDGLTGALNVQAFREVVLGALEQHAHRATTPGCIAYIDADALRQMNDLYGHQAGDELLRLVVARMKDALPPTAHIARFGGDEFVAFFEGEGLGASEAAARSLLNALSSRPFAVGQHSLPVRCFLGLTEIRSDRSTATPAEDGSAEPPPDPLPSDDVARLSRRVNEAMRAADFACKRARVLGGDNLVVLRPGTSEHIRFNETMRHAYRIAGDADLKGFSLRFQPLVSVSDPDAALNLRALFAPWRELGAQPYSEEQRDRLEAALKRSGRQAHADIQQLESLFKLLWGGLGRNTNLQRVLAPISAATLNDEHASAAVINLLRRHLDAAHLVALQIDDATSVLQSDRIPRFVELAKRYNCQVVLGGFDASAAATPLVDLPIDGVRLSEAMIARALTDQPVYSLMTGVIKMTREMGRWVVAPCDASRVTKVALAGADFLDSVELAPLIDPAALDARTMAADLIDKRQLERIHRAARVVRDSIAQRSRTAPPFFTSTFEASL